MCLMKPLFGSFCLNSKSVITSSAFKTYNVILNPSLIHSFLVEGAEIEPISFLHRIDSIGCLAKFDFIIFWKLPVGASDRLFRLSWQWLSVLLSLMLRIRFPELFLSNIFEGPALLFVLGFNDWPNWRVFFVSPVFLFHDQSVWLVLDREL